ncbi:Inner membrane ABC transporter permease protein YtfT [compost metagenome]
MASLATGGHSLPVIVASVLGVGLLCGLWNGLLVAVFKIQPIVATLILMVAGRGIAQLITEGQIITFNNEALAWIGSGALFYLPTPVIITLGMALLLWLLTKRTALGLFIEAVGINIKAAKNAGLNTPMVVIATYLLSGIMAAVAGMIVAADIRGADANNAGLWLEMDAILAVVIGGTSLMGGRFNLALSLVGILIIQGVNTGILLSGYQPQWNQIVKAMVVLAVLVMQSPALNHLFQRGTRHV